MPVELSSSQGQEHPDKAKRGRRKQEKENTNGFCKRFTGLNGKWVFDCAGLSSSMSYEYFDNCEVLFDKHYINNDFPSSFFSSPLFLSFLFFSPLFSFLLSPSLIYLKKLHKYGL